MATQYAIRGRATGLTGRSALEEITFLPRDPDRRVWRRAHARPRPDEDGAEPLERSAGRTQAGGGLAAAAAFLERPAERTGEPVRRARSLFAAARAKRDGGAPRATAVGPVVDTGDMETV
jgi:hypothetical protein